MFIGRWVGLMGMTAMGLLTGSAQGQEYPNKPIRMLAPPGGTPADLMSRIVAQGTAGPLGVPVVVENRPGTVLGDATARAAPDGYTIASGGSVFWITPLLQKTSYDAIKDLIAITTISTSPFVLAVNPSFPAKSVAELITAAKAKPGALTYASGPTGGATHLSGALFTSMAGINMLRVPFKGNPEALTAVFANNIPIVFGDVTMLPSVKAGKLRALAITSAEPSPLAPGIPPISSSGLSGYDSPSVLGMFAPSGTPPEMVNRLNQEMVKVLARPDVKEKALNMGIEAIGETPAQFAAFIKSDVAKWGKLIKEAGITTD